MFSYPEVDVVLISAANVALAPLTRAAVESGKHVSVKKLGAARSREPKEIAKIAERTGARVRIGYNHRFHPAFVKMAEIPAQEDREWRADPKLSGGGELIDQGVHLIDLASIWLGEFELFSDEFSEMKRQALKIKGWQENVFVKIPITKAENLRASAREILNIIQVDAAGASILLCWRCAYKIQ
jgi:predicted dehydrogenase